jgi:hypothetical protein
VDELSPLIFALTVILRSLVKDIIVRESDIYILPSHLHLYPDSQMGIQAEGTKKDTYKYSIHRREIRF